MALDPILDALLEHLPAPGDYFPQEERKRWLQLVELTFDLIYNDNPSGTEGEPNTTHGD